MPLSAEQIDALDELSAVTTPPMEAFTVVRSILMQDKSDEALEAAYEAVRNVVYQIVAGRIADSTTDLWNEVVLRIQSATKARNGTLSERFLVLSDLLEQVRRSALIQPASELAKRKHVRQILEILAGHEGYVGRASLAAKTGLKDANLSRVLGNLVSAGLVDRRVDGREVSIAITDVGRIQISSPKPQPQGSDRSAADRKMMDTLFDAWTRAGSSYAIASEAEGVVQFDEGFARLLGGTRKEDIEHFGTEDIRSQLNVMRNQSFERVANEVIAREGTSFEVAEYTHDGLIIWLAHDVSPYKAEIQRAQRREKALMARVEELRRARVKPDLAPPGDFFASGSMPMIGYIRNLKTHILAPTVAICNASRILESQENARVTYTTSSSFALPHVAHQLSLISAESQRLNDFVNELIVVYDTSARKDLVFDRVQPGAVVRKVLDDARSAPSGRNQIYDFSEDHHEYIETDEVLLRACIRGTIEGFSSIVGPGARISLAATESKDDWKLSITAPGVTGPYFSYSEGAAPLDVCRKIWNDVGGRMEIVATDNRFEATCSVRRESAAW